MTKIVVMFGDLMGGSPKMDPNSILIVLLTVISIIIFPTIFYWQVKKHNPKRFYIFYQSGPRLDFDLIQDIIVKSLLLGGSVFVFSNIIIYGITGSWLLPYSYEASRVGLVIGGLLFIISVIKGLYNYTKDKIEEGMVSTKKSDTVVAKTRTIGQNEENKISDLK